MTSTTYDAAILGAGPAGYSAALHLSARGKKTCLIDISRAHIGGVCLNEGCIPAKSLLHSAELYRYAGEAQSRGIYCDNITFDMTRVVAAARESSSLLRKGLAGIIEKRGIEFIEGRGELTHDAAIRVVSEDGGEMRIVADAVIIATGSYSRVPEPFLSKRHTILTSREALGMTALPSHLAVVGAGAIGCEFSTFFSSFGCRITLIEMQPDILPAEDKEITGLLRRVFKSRGVTIHTSARIEKYASSDTGLRISLRCGADDIYHCDADAVLVAAGRVPRTADIGLEKAGVDTDSRGYITVNAHMQTRNPRVYAAGDVVSSPLYAHVAYAEGLTAAGHICDGQDGVIDYSSIPNVMYTFPQIASVGLSEADARAKGYSVQVARAFFRGNGLAVASGAREGFVKLVADKGSRRLLGAHIISRDATEILHECVVAKRAGLPVDVLASAVHAHPTMSETIAEAARGLFGLSLHG